VLRRLVLASCLLIALPGAAARAQAPDRAALLREYLPVLVFHPEELWPPADPDAFVRASRLEERGAAGGWKSSTRPGLPDASVPCPRRPCFRLDLQPCALGRGPDCYRPLAGKLATWTRPVVVGNVVDVRDAPADLKGLPEPPRLLVRYWLFYDLDDWHSVSPKLLWQLHEGDWESVTVALGQSGTPLFVATSRHCRGAWRPWARQPVVGGTHPQVFVALGSHAVYATSGSQRNFPLACAKAGGELGVLIRLARRAGVRSDDRTGRGRTVGVAASPLSLIDLTIGTRPPWSRFAGVWSEGEILYLHRFGLTRTAQYGEGPRTPGFDADVTRLVLERWAAE
jgi:hypothetical protein